MILNKIGATTFITILIIMSGGSIAQNITAPNNAGIITQGQIGSNTIVQKPPPRHMDAAAEKQLMDLPRDRRILVRPIFGVEDANAFAREIEDFLASQGFPVMRSHGFEVSGDPKPGLTFEQRGNTTVVIVGPQN